MIPIRLPIHIKTPITTRREMSEIFDAHFLYPTIRSSCNIIPESTNRINLNPPQSHLIHLWLRIHKSEEMRVYDLHTTERESLEIDESKWMIYRRVVGVPSHEHGLEFPTFLVISSRRIWVERGVVACHLTFNIQLSEIWLRSS